MSLDKLAVELEETARQTAEMIDKINDSLGILMNNSLGCQEARSTAVQEMVIALQAQDRIQQRCDNIAKAARLMAKVVDEISEKIDDKDVWSNLTLDELRKPNLSGIAGRAKHDDIELF
ncbi:hypothetical protein [Maritalea sp.]|jgi:methyl-accepting chemotaxis protein|uniref:hypothetical protein n=1 Tax=Maritalea sp. TaxID=2003361 RepID=UPI0039E4DE60